MSARILIVDDNVINLKLATDVLACAGHAIAGAEDAARALALLEQAPPDIILLDLAMPGMDGPTLARRIKADARFRQIPIVALTASAMKGDESRALAAGFDGYITKPIDTRRFPAQVAGYLARPPGAAP